MRKFALGAAAAIAMIAASETSTAAILKIPEASFTAAAGLITFSEKALDTNNPIYAPADYGGGASSPTVSFGGYFTGQHLGTASSPCPVTAALSGCVLSSADSYLNPTANGPLTLDPSSPVTFIATDSSNLTSPVLSGTPLFNGPIAILFSMPQVGVGLDGGYFDSVGSTAITAFAADGAVLGQVINTVTGIEFLGLITSDNSATIAGLLFSLVGDESAGFAVDNIRFGILGEVVSPTDIPEPGSIALLASGLLLLSLARQRNRRPLTL